MQRSTRAALAALWAGVALLLASSAHAEPGDRITRNPFPLGDSVRSVTDPDIAMQGDGAFVATWADSDGIWARLFAPDGTPRGPVIVVSGSFNFASRLPRVAIAADGGFVVVWQEVTIGPGTVLYRIFGRMFDSTGAPRGPGLSVSPPDRSGDGVGASLAMAPDGRIVVAWAQDDPDFNHIGTWVRIYAADGTPQGTPFRATAPPWGDHYYSHPEVAAAANGDFTVVWVQTINNAPGALRAKRYSPTAAPLGAAFTVTSSNASGEVFHFKVAMSAAGELAVAYPRQLASGQSTGIYVRRYDASGGLRGAEFKASTGNAYRADTQIAMNAAGDFALSWLDPGSYPAPRPVHARLYRASGAAVTPDMRVPIEFLGNSLDQTGGVAIDDRGNFVVAITGTRFFPDGSRSAPVHGQGFAGYLDTRPSCLQIIATQVGTNQADTITGTPDADVVLALGGNDRIDTGDGADVICGGAGDDVIFAGPGNDRIAAGSGDDVIDGGDGDFDYCNGEGHTNADTAVSCEFTDNIP
jgi:hypothetical protein